MPLPYHAACVRGPGAEAQAHRQLGQAFALACAAGCSWTPAHLCAECAQLDVGGVGDVPRVAFLPVQRYRILLVRVRQQVYRACPHTPTTKQGRRASESCQAWLCLPRPLDTRGAAQAGRQAGGRCAVQAAPLMRALQQQQQQGGAHACPAAAAAAGRRTLLPCSGGSGSGMRKALTLVLQQRQESDGGGDLADDGLDLLRDLPLRLLGQRRAARAAGTRVAGLEVFRAGMLSIHAQQPRKNAAVTGGRFEESNTPWLRG